VKKNYEDLTSLARTAGHKIEQAETISELEQLRVTYLGRKSAVANLAVELKNLDNASRPVAGQAINRYKNTLEQLIRERHQAILSSQQYPPIDVTRPGQATPVGHLHPISHVLEEVYAIFSELGFAIVDGPEVVTDWYNFGALNLPEHHPARDMQDTFYIKTESAQTTLLPRTHTSSMQVRFMEENQPPFKIIAPGKAFRNEDEDSTHSWSFTQVEGLVVGEGVTMADLKGTLLRVVQGLLGEETEIRLRPNYFPYTEPSVEIDARYRGQWLELLGAGMVHPRVLKNGGIDPEKYTAFAFGFGAERIATVKYNLTDLRQLWRPNFNYMEQF